MERPATEDQGPACRSLRDHLDSHRPPLPPVLRLSLVLSAACAGAMALLLGAGFLVNIDTGILLAEFIGLTTVSGPQAATLFVFKPPQGDPLGIEWVLAMGTLNMAATLFLVVPLAYRGFERLRDNRILGGILRSTERYSVKHRRFLARWGLLGLVLVTFAPVQGAGVLGAGLLGVLLRIPPARLLASVFSAGLVLTVAWVFVIRYAADAMPKEGPLVLLPYLVVAGLVALAAAATVRGHLRRHQFEVETIPGTPAEQVKKLAQVGIDEQDIVLHADLRVVCQKLGIPESDLKRARNTAEILRLDNVPPKAGERLTAAGIATIRELATAPASLVRDALAEVARTGFKVPTLETVRDWQEEAVRWDREFHKQVNAYLRSNKAPPRAGKKKRPRSPRK